MAGFFEIFNIGMHEYNEAKITLPVTDYACCTCYLDMVTGV
jgi:hypothetical protein